MDKQSGREVVRLVRDNGRENFFGNNTIFELLAETRISSGGSFNTSPMYLLGHNTLFQTTVHDLTRSVKIGKRELET